jgi:hypothetical protein
LHYLFSHIHIQRGFFVFLAPTSKALVRKSGSGGSLPASQERGRCASSFVPGADLDGRKKANNRPAAIKLNHREEMGPPLLFKFQFA